MTTDIIIDLEEPKSEEIEIDIIEVVDYVTGVSNKPAVNGVVLEGNKTTEDLGINVDTSHLATKEELSEKADKNEIPDVQIKGTSIIKDGVANIPSATTSELGLVKTNPNEGISASSQGELCIVSANQNEIESKEQSYKPITPENLDHATKTSITTNTIELTEEEKQAAKKWLGVPTNTSELENDSGFITDEALPTSLEGLAIGGDGIKLSEEREQNYKEYFRSSAYSGEFTYSEDGTHLLGVPMYGSLLMEKVDLDEEFKASFRIKFDASNTSARPYFCGFSTSYYLTHRVANGMFYVQAYLGTSISAYFSLTDFTEDTLDIVLTVKRPEQNTCNITLEIVDLAGKVLATSTKETVWNFVGTQTYLGNRSTGSSQTLNLDLTNTWMEQNDIRYYALKTFEKPRTIIAIDEFDKFQKNKAGETNSLVLGSLQNEGKGSYRSGFNANRIEANGSAYGGASEADEYAAAFGYNAIAHFGAVQMGEGYAEPFEVSAKEHPILDFSGKLYKDRLPLVAGEGISLSATEGERYRVIGDAKVEDGILKFGTAKNERSCLVSTGGGYVPQSFLEFQVALKDVPAGTESYSGSSDYLIRTYMPNGGTTREDGTKYFRAPYLRYHNSKDSGYPRIYYYGFHLAYNILTNVFDSGDILIKETIENGTATLRYSLDDGATWVVLTTQTISDPQTAIGTWTMLVGQPENYEYVSTSNYTGSIDLNKSFLYLSSDRNNNVLLKGAKKPINEVVISAQGGEAEGTSSYRSLNETQKNEALNEGTYEGVAIEDGEVFTEYDGKFVEHKITTHTASEAQPVATPIASGKMFYWKGALYKAPKNSTTWAKSLDGGDTWETFTSNKSTGSYPGQFHPFGDILLWTQGNVSAKTIMYYSTDGKNWSQSSTPEYNTLVGELNGKIFFRSVNGQSLIVSSDGISWSSVTLPETSVDFVYLILNGKLFAYTARQSNAKVYISEDEGSSWTVSQTSSSWRPWATYAYVSSANGIAIATNGCSYGTTTPCVSTDGINWTTISGINNNWNNLCYLPEKDIYYFYPGALDDINTIYSSKDCRAWSAISLPASFDDFGLTYSSNAIYFGSTTSSSTTMYRMTGESWEEYHLYSLSYTKEEVDAAVAGAGYLMNNTTYTGSLAIFGTVSSTYGTAIGYDSEATSQSFAAGRAAKATGSNSSASGSGAKATANFSSAYGYLATASGDYSIAFGTCSKATAKNAIAIGSYSSNSSGAYARATAENAMQFGPGENNVANTVNFGLSNTLNVQLLDANGQIPAERLTNVLGDIETLLAAL